MPTQLSNIRWVSVLVAAVLVYVVSLALLFALVTAYASLLAFQARGAPDPVQISQFADQVAPWAGPIILILITLMAGVWLGRQAGVAGPLNGLVLGVLAGTLNLVILFSFGTAEILTLVLTVAAGCTGVRAAVGNKNSGAKASRISHDHPRSHPRTAFWAGWWAAACGPAKAISQQETGSYQSAQARRLNLSQFSASGTHICASGLIIRSPMAVVWSAKARPCSPFSKMCSS